jgi:hypothetical protein
MEMHKKIARLFIIAAEKAESAKSKLNILKLLALLGGQVKVAREPGEPSGDDEPEEFQEAPKSDPQMLNKLMVKVKHSSEVFDKAFKEEISAYVSDMDEYDAVFKKSPARVVFDGIVKKKKSPVIAANFFDDATSYVLKDILKTVKQVHGGTGEKKNREEALFLRFGKGDPNSSVFKEGYRFMGTVESEDATKSFFYQIKVEGADITPKTYLMDASEHELDMDEGEKYKMEVIKEVHDGKNYGVDIKAEGHTIGMNVHPMIEARQVPAVVYHSTLNFVRDELPKLLGDTEKIEADKKALIKIIERQKKEIAEKEKAGEDPADLQKALKPNEEKLRKLIDLGMEGLADPDVLTETDEKVKPISETEKTLIYRKKDPHNRWKNIKPVPPKEWIKDPSKGRKEKPYSAPGTSEIEEEFSEEDYSKLKNEILHSLDDKGKVDDAGNVVPPKALGGVSYEDLLKMMWSAIDAAGNKLRSNPNAWKTLFVKKLEKHMTDKGIDYNKNKFYEIRDKLIADIQEQILTNEEFKRLRDNLVQHIQRQVLKKAADVLTEKITKAWESPSEEKIRDAYTEALLDMEERDKGVGTPVQFITMVQKPTEEGFRRALGKNLPEALKLLSVLSGIKPPKAVPGITHTPNEPIVTNEEKAFQHVTKKYSLPGEASKALMGLIKVTQLRRTAPAQTQKQMKDILEKNKITGEAAERIKAIFERATEMDYQTHNDPAYKAPDLPPSNLVPQQKLTPKEKEKMIADKAEDLKKRYPGTKINEILPSLGEYASGKIMNEKRAPLERAEDIRKFLKEYPGWLAEDFLQLQKLLKEGTKTAFTSANFESMIGRLKKLFLLEVWHLEDKDMDQKIDLYHQYDETFPSEEERNSDIVTIRHKIRDDIKKFTAENPMGVKEEPKTEKTPKQKKVKVEKPTSEIVDKRDSVVLERLRKFRETLKAT